MPDTSLWLATTQAPDRRNLTPPGECDVVVIGAGIAGLTTAYQLASAGLKVVVLEARRVGAGVTGHTTAKLTTQHGTSYQQISKRHGFGAVALYAESQRSAQAWLIDTAMQLGIDCELEQCSSYVYTTDPRQVDTLHADASAAHSAGLPAAIADPAEVPVRCAGAVRFERQARFHPQKWLLGLAAAIERAGSVIVEGVRVTDVQEGTPLGVRAEQLTVRATNVVVATHHPVLDRGLFFARLAPSRELVIAGPSSRIGDFPDMYLDNDSRHSMRLAKDSDGSPLLLVGGEPYPVGERVDVQAKHEKLVEWARPLGLETPTYRWSAHDFRTVDGLPYVGKYHPRAQNLWVAAGFNHWGMTGGTMAGRLLASLITGHSVPWAELYDPNRLAARSTGRYAKIVGRVARHFVGDRLSRAGTSSGAADALGPGEGRVIREGAHLVAAYRTPEGALQSVSARCTHLGCVVNFNNDEKTWDCPCHGSRFGTDGKVIQGPAVEGLPEV